MIKVKYIPEIDNTYAGKEIKTYIEPTQRFSGDWNELQYSDRELKQIKYMTVWAKSEKSNYLMESNEKGEVKGTYSIVSKRFGSPEKAKEYFEKHFHLIELKAVV